MDKKKISFDLPEDQYEDIKKFCEKKGQKLSEYWRAASIEKLERDRNRMIIFVFLGGKIEKLQINKRDFEINIVEASETMKENVNAVCEGILRLHEEIEGEDTHILFGDKDREKITHALYGEEDASLSFYTREDYC